MQIAIPRFDDLTALDAIGPYEVLSRLPGAQVVFVGAEARPYVSDNGMLRMHA
jgi:putative intracellular protease/amidase